MVYDKQKFKKGIMSSVQPISLISYKNNSPSFKSKAKTDDAKEPKEKRKLGWKKGLLLGAIATAFVVEFVTKRNPERRLRQLEYEKIFSGTHEKGERFLPMLTKREEVIITEAAKGNKTAQKLMDAVRGDGVGISKYLKAKQKYENIQSYLKDGVFDKLKRGCDKTPEDTKKWLLSESVRLKNSMDSLYEEFILPIS